MRKTALVLLAPFSIAACGSTPPTAANAPAHQDVAIAKPAPAPLVDPPGLVTVAQPASSQCQLDWRTELDLAATPDGAPLFHVSAVATKVGIGSQGDPFVVATTPDFTLRGFLARDSSYPKFYVLPAKWLSFGGVYFPAEHDPIALSVHDGKLSVTASEDHGFHFTGSNGTIDVGCDDIALNADPNGVLRNTLPAAYEKHDGKLSVMKYMNGVALSATADGPALGTFDVHTGPATVTVIERKGKKAHIRSGHFIGWVDASALKPFTPSTRKDLDALGAMPAHHGDPMPPGSYVEGRVFGVNTPVSTLVCTEDVRVLALSTATPSSPFVVGTIPAGKTVHLSSHGDDVSEVVLETLGRVSPDSLVRLAVPNKDLASCAPGNAAPTAVARDDDASESAADAIDELPAETPKKSTPKPSIGIGIAPCTGLACIGATPGNREYPMNELSNRPEPKPTIRQLMVRVSGPLSAAVVQSAIRQSQTRLRFCYEKALNQDPSISGRLEIQALIDAKGSVTQANITGGDISNATLLDCFRRQLKSIVFPASSGVTSVTYGAGLTME